MPGLLKRWAGQIALARKKPYRRMGGGNNTRAEVNARKKMALAIFAEMGKPLQEVQAMSAYDRAVFNGKWGTAIMQKTGCSQQSATTARAGAIREMQGR